MWRFQMRYFDDLKAHIKQLSRICIKNTYATKRHTNVQPQHVQENYISMLERRRRQAKHSFLVQHSCSEDWILQYCQKFGTIANAFHQKGEEKGLTLIEFTNQSAVERVFTATNHFKNERNIPVASRHLFFRLGNASQNIPHGKKRFSRCVYEQPSDSQLSDSDLLRAKSLDEQIVLLHRKLSLTEMGCRLRHFICCHIEEMLEPMLPECDVQPFGSAVNGFGKHNCDLDMVLNLDHSLPEQNLFREGSSEPLFFMTKLRPEDDRLFSQHVLSIVDGVLHHLIPHTTFVRPILKARVPIVKFRHLGSDIDCDICISNSAGLYMSELLYDFGQLDPRVSPLVFVIRYWARVNQVTHGSPGPWMSNFTLTLLVAFFLQTRSIPVLPAVQTMKDLAESADRRDVNGIDCSFVSDLGKIPPTLNTEPLRELLKQFFDFYSNFDFSTKAISLIHASTYGKREIGVPLHLENPIEPDLNVSKNIMETELKKFVDSCQLAFRTLNEHSEKAVTGQSWGLPRILQEQEHSDKVLIDMNLANIFSKELTSSSKQTDGNMFPRTETEPSSESYTPASSQASTR